MTTATITFTVDVAFATEDTQTYTVQAKDWKAAAVEAMRLAISDGLEDLRFANVYDDVSKPERGCLEFRI